jgi:hypothetical protein
MSEKEKLKSVQAHVPEQQEAWLQARAIRHQRSVSAEVRSLLHFAMQAEHLLGVTEVFYVTAQAPAGEAA